MREKTLDPSAFANTQTNRRLALSKSKDVATKENEKHTALLVQGLTCFHSVTVLCSSGGRVEAFSASELTCDTSSPSLDVLLDDTDPLDSEPLSLV